MNAVFLEANSDGTTKTVHEARRKALAVNSAYPEYKLFGADAYYTDVKSTHGNNGGFHLFSGMGHGNSEAFTGQWESVIYDLQNSKSINHTVRGAIVHLYSCECAQRLGPGLVSLGAKAFIGYMNPVVVPTQQSLVDEFVKVAAAIDRSILDRDSSSTTKRKADAEFTAVEARLRAPGSAATARDVASFRMNHQSMVGPWSDLKYGSY